MLPLIVAEAHEDTLVVTTNGDKATATTIARTDFWTHIAEQVSALGVATRVEMHEPDGRVLADILDPPPPESDTSDEDDTDRADDGAEESGLVELTGEDFTSGRRSSSPSSSGTPPPMPVAVPVSSSTGASSTSTSCPSRSRWCWPGASRAP